MTAEASAEREAVLDTLRQIAEAFDAKDLDRLAALHHRGPESSLIAPDGKRYRGWQQVEAHLDRSVNEFPYSRTRLDDAEVFLFGDVAVVSYRQSTNSRIHDIEFQWEGLVTDVFVRSEGGWRRVHHHASDLPRG